MLWVKTHHSGVNMLLVKTHNSGVKYAVGENTQQRHKYAVGENTPQRRKYAVGENTPQRRKNTQQRRKAKQLQLIPPLLPALPEIRSGCLPTASHHLQKCV